MSYFAKSPCCGDDVVRVELHTNGKIELLRYECNKCGRKLEPDEFTGMPRIVKARMKCKLMDLLGPKREPFYNELRRLVREL